MRNVLLLAALLGCTKAPDRATPEPAPAPPGPTNPQPPTPVPVEPPKLTHAPVPPTMRDYGACRVSIRGPATIEQLAGGPNVSLSYWDLENDRWMFPAGKQGLSLSCEGPQASLQFLTSDETAATFPNAPKKYTLDRVSKNVVGLIGSLNDAERTYFQNAEGTFEITAIDASHIAGTFDLKAGYVMKSGRSGDATIKGTFDYKCPSKCK
jgi:hypothetical protein